MTPEEVRRLQHLAAPWFAEQEVLKAFKKSAAFRALVARVARHAEQQLLAVSPTHVLTPLPQPHEGRAETGLYLPLTYVVEKRRRRGESRVLLHYTRWYTSRDHARVGEGICQILN